MNSTKPDVSSMFNALTCPITHEIFVDPVLASDGYTYERSAIIQWIRYHNGTSPMICQTIQIKELKPNRIIKQIADHYRPSITASLPKEITRYVDNGTLLNEEQKLDLKRLFPKEKKWLLIYKATEDGFKASDFHSHCDNRGPTLTLIQSRHRFQMRKSHSIFGGYTTIPWSSRGTCSLDSQSFLVLLDGNQIRRFNIRSPNAVAVTHDRASGPIFGLDDIHIHGRANERYESFTNFPLSYLDTHGQGPKTFSKWKKFLVSEIEVYMM